MPIKTPEDLRADRIAVRKILQFEDRLNTETDEGRYKVLASLLANECEELTKETDVFMPSPNLLSASRYR